MIGLRDNTLIGAPMLQFCNLIGARYIQHLIRQHRVFLPFCKHDNSKIVGFFTQAIFTHTQLRFPPKKHACLGLGLCQNVVFGHEKCFFNSVSEVSRNIIYEQRLLYIAQKSISFDDIVFFLAASHARPMFYLLFHTYNAVFCHSYVVQFSFSIERWEGKLQDTNFQPVQFPLFFLHHITR